MPFLFFRRRINRALYLEHQTLTRSNFWSLMTLIALIFLHSLSMVVFENLSFGDAAWMTLTTITTVGYGDLAAKTAAGRLATFLFIYLGGIYLLANLAGAYFDVRRNRKQRMLRGDWGWRMDGHILIINSPAHGAVSYLERLTRQIRLHHEFADAPVLLLTSAFPQGLPTSLRDLGIVHHNGAADQLGGIDCVDPGHARAVIILAKDEYDARSDALTFDILYRLGELPDRPSPVISECIQDENRTRFHKVGATQVIRPSRAYPEILVRALVAPGSEAVLENLFDYEGDHTRRYDIGVSGCRWGDLVSEMVQRGIGTPLAYISELGSAVCNPDPGQRVVAIALIILVRSEAIADLDQVREGLSVLKGVGVT